MGLWHSAALAAAAALAGEAAAGLEVCPSGLRCNRTQEDRHFWPRARGHVGSFGVTPLEAPRNLSAALAWSWHHPDGRYHDTIIGGPNVDEHKNLYVSGTRGIHKFSPDGQLLWTIEPKSGSWFIHNLALMGGALYTNRKDGAVLSASLETGKTLWETQLNESIGGDTAYVEVRDGLVFTACRAADARTGGGGNLKIVALNGSDGTVLWEYVSEKVLWNFMPMFTDDGTFVTMDMHGGVYRLGTYNGSLLWQTPPPHAYAHSFTDGFVSLGPDGTVFTCSNLEFGTAGTQGALRAYRLDDGTKIWDRLLSQPCISFAVSDGETVYIPHGPFPAPILVTEMPRWMPTLFKVLVHIFDVVVPAWYKQKILRWAPKQSEIWAVDARTGEVRWKYLVPLYYEWSAKGDTEGFEDRRVHVPMRLICLPAAWGSPTLTGDGAVHAGNMDGWVYSVRDANGDGSIDPETEVSRFDSGGAFLHFGPVVVPGMMAFTNCDSLYVFKY